MAEKRSEIVEINLNDRVATSEGYVTCYRLPLPVSHRLDQLVGEVAIRTSRAELIAALITDTDVSDAETLERGVMQYRKMTVGDLFSDEPK